MDTEILGFRDRTVEVVNAQAGELLFWCVRGAVRENRCASHEQACGKHTTSAHWPVKLPCVTQVQAAG